MNHNYLIYTQGFHEWPVKTSAMLSSHAIGLPDAKLFYIFFVIAHCITITEFSNYQTQGGVATITQHHHKPGNEWKICIDKQHKSLFTIASTTCHLSITYYNLKCVSEIMSFRWRTVVTIFIGIFIRFNVNNRHSNGSATMLLYMRWMEKVNDKLIINYYVLINYQEFFWEYLSICFSLLNKSIYMNSSPTLSS